MATETAQRRELGLHGHELHSETGRAAVAEVAGTFVLVLAIVSVAVAATLNTPVAGGAYSSETVALAGGGALALVVAALGPLSGAHLNPAVTVALALTGRFPWGRVPAYVVAQLAGALLAAVAAWGAYGDQARTVANLGATGPAAEVGSLRVLFVEALVTFVLVLVVVLVANDARVGRGAAALAIGLALTVAILISGPVTGAGVNPARALGPMIAAARFTDWWAYLIGPLLGGAVATYLYEKVLKA
ncbi:aquaporin [Actinoplanes sp. TRM 88003]|uniref:Aquaporin n=1 Tax=Paractinoplanes aksuensis TaxID=2939490 RepID=A0ABT1DTI8_9ACTN|nr:aquaporin [Actinoplanes aksuensis]MCO8274173.1 aquaporin [Actinoplanes aksuensis]